MEVILTNVAEDAALKLRCALCRGIVVHWRPGTLLRIEVRDPPRAGFPPVASRTMKVFYKLFALDFVIHA